ncbi:MAG: MerR family DNA-binding protein [Gemmataceae bacterium]|nr:MerR family DNA-binding protein [Gemmataceae bacterium]
MPPRRTSGYRDYPPQAMDRVRFIKRAQELGFSLKEVQELLPWARRPAPRPPRSGGWPRPRPPTSTARSKTSRRSSGRWRHCFPPATAGARPRPARSSSPSAAARAAPPPRPTAPEPRSAPTPGRHSAARFLHAGPLFA